MSYLKPLRRKFGVATLLVACVFTAGWVRSLYLTDFFHVHYPNSKRTPVMTSFVRFFSGRSRFGLIIVAPKGGLSVSNARWHETSSSPPDESFAANARTTWRFLGLEARVGQIFLGNPDDDEWVYLIPFAWFVIPLILLSAYLLLSKRGPSKRVESAITTAN